MSVVIMLKKYPLILLVSLVFTPMELLASDRSLKIENTDASFSYNIPIQKYGKKYWRLLPGDSFAENILSESLSGLLALAVNESRCNTMVWLETPETSYNAYGIVRQSLPMQCLGKEDIWALLEKDNIKDVINGYILCDQSNHESINAATVAAHVYNGLIVDSSISDKVDSLGYRCLFDASSMSLEDSWQLFKDKCNNEALVMMPALTFHQRSTAIAFRLFSANLNKVSNRPELGNNSQLLEQVLSWLAPLSPVFGWEQSVGEDSFVSLVTKSGNIMVPFDWVVNVPLMSAEYGNRQKGQVKHLDPRKINYGDSDHYMSFYMSDGDNVQWAINAYNSPSYFSSSDIPETQMSFGYPLVNMSMLCPGYNNYLLSKQNENSSLIENFGGGYYYADEFAIYKNRKELLARQANSIASVMNKYGCSILGLACMDVDSDNAKEAYQSFISANDDLDGIIVIQYSPYAGGNGKIMWFTNKRGVHIPVITVRYSIWNFGPGINYESEGAPEYIASKYNDMVLGSPENTFSVTSIHAWSSFPSGEDSGLNVCGVGSASLCQEKLNGNIKIVNIEELIWQLRMHVYPEETRRVLNL